MSLNLAHLVPRQSWAKDIRLGQSFSDSDRPTVPFFDERVHGHSIVQNVRRYGLRRFSCVNSSGNSVHRVVDMIVNWYTSNDVEEFCDPWTKRKLVLLVVITRLVAQCKSQRTSLISRIGNPFEHSSFLPLFLSTNSICGWTNVQALQRSTSNSLADQ